MKNKSLQIMMWLALAAAPLAAQDGATRTQRKAAPAGAAYTIQDFGRLRQNFGRVAAEIFIVPAGLDSNLLVVFAGPVNASTRRVEIPLVEGKNEIDLTALASDADEVTFQVKGQHGVTLRAGEGDRTVVTMLKGANHYNRIQFANQRATVHSAADPLPVIGAEQ